MVGVPANATKIGLFITVAVCGWVHGMVVLFQTSRSNVIEGVGQEFYFIIAAVLGGCLLTGGFGSIVGAALGCLILGMTQQGIPLAGWDNNLYFLFLGVILLVAAFANEWIRRWATHGVAPTSESTRRRKPARAEAPQRWSRPTRRSSHDAVEAATPAGGTRRRRATPCSSCSGVSKFFGNVIALQNITTSVHAGEVTCVLGDNGAGKSTFIKILAGVHRHDERQLLDGGPARSTFHSPREAKAAGIATVYQDLAMAPLMSIWRNFCLGSEPTTVASARSTSRRPRQSPSTRWRKMGIDVRDPEQPVGTLSGGERQSRGHRPRRVLRRQGADPRRADGRPRRQAVGRRAAVHRRRPRPWPRRDLHHPQPAPRLSRSATAS